ncbi:ABC transporter substrate-binding protein [Paramagnetospirillum marisnigri]|uniref:ABC transporter substrate-binding protein n=1 Tax=Paramagnetospirillum marisnigri TaxID=1285242 RepID=A0A178MQM3_9PROT|nr:ABC transporter substrate-binding protein [Paramagnetospirillum marisnigri]OAN51243.1 ABC transporter substrate-binding protein [Paramagnetospirillum marisnigri]
MFDTPISRRRSLDFMAAGGLAAVMAAKGGLARAAEDEVVRIGHLPITDATALLVAHALGAFEEEGLKTEPPVLIRGWAPLAEGFAAGKFNLVHLLKPIPVWMRYNNNIPVKIVAWAHTNGSGLVVGSNTGITSFADLGGRQIAVPFWYSMHNIVLQIGIRSAGLTPVIKAAGEPLAKTEVNLQVLQPPEMPPALAAGKIDGYIVAEPFNALGELKAGGRILRFTGDIWKNHPCCVVAMHEADTVKRPEWSQKVVNAVVKAQIYASKNKKEVARLISQDGKGYIPLPAALVERAVTHYDDPDYDKLGANRHKKEWGNDRIDFQPWPYPSATKLIVEAMTKTVVSGDKTFLDKLDPDFVVKDLVTTDFVKKALVKYPEWKDDPSVNKGDPFNRVEQVVV